MGIPSEAELVERMIASAVISVCTRYVVEVERELLQLRLSIAEKGSTLGNLELLGAVEERLGKVHDRMNGGVGDLLKLVLDVRKELSRIGIGASATALEPMKKRGRPGKSKEA